MSDLTADRPTGSQRLGVVIVNFNGGDCIGRCLSAVARSSCRPAATVVVDNASTDGSPEIVERDFPWVTVLRRTQNDGFTGGANAGLQWCLAAGHDGVALLNPDAFVEPDAIEALAAASGRHARSIIGPKLVLDDQPAVVNVAGPSISWWRGRSVGQYPVASAAEPSGDLRVGALSGCCLLIPRLALEVLGVLDQRYFLYFEDLDFAARAQAAGWSLWIAPAAVVRHRESSSTGGRGSPVAMYYFVRNRHLFVGKFQRGRPVYVAFLLYETIDVLARTALAVACARPALARAIWQGLVDAWRGRDGARPAPGRTAS